MSHITVPGNVAFHFWMEIPVDSVWTTCRKYVDNLLRIGEACCYQRMFEEGSNIQQVAHNRR